jgi:hypothetical protein
LKTSLYKEDPEEFIQLIWLRLHLTNVGYVTKSMCDLVPTNTFVIDLFNVRLALEHNFGCKFTDHLIGARKSFYFINFYM